MYIFRPCQLETLYVFLHVLFLHVFQISHQLILVFLTTLIPYILKMYDSFKQ